MGAINADWPGFFWRWEKQRIGWFRRGLVRVCDNPAYAPIIGYRIRRPRGLQILDAILADVDAPTTPDLTPAGGGLPVFDGFPAKTPAGGAVQPPGALGPFARRQPARLAR